MWGVIRILYSMLGLSVENGWLPGIAIYMILFVLYRNKLQFTGFYEGPNQQKLPHTISVTFITCAILLLVLSPFLHFLS